MGECKLIFYLNFPVTLKYSHLFKIIRVFKKIKVYIKGCYEYFIQEIFRYKIVLNMRVSLKNLITCFLSHIEGALIKWLIGFLRITTYIIWYFTVHHFQSYFIISHLQIQAFDQRTYSQSCCSSFQSS